MKIEYFAAIIVVLGVLLEISWLSFVKSSGHPMSLYWIGISIISLAAGITVWGYHLVDKRKIK